MSMPDTRTVNSVKKVNNANGDLDCLKAVINGVEMFVPPNDFNNIDRKFEYKEYNEYLKWDKNGKFDIDNFLTIKSDALSTCFPYLLDGAL